MNKIKMPTSLRKLFLKAYDNVRVSGGIVYIGVLRRKHHKWYWADEMRHYGHCMTSTQITQVYRERIELLRTENEKRRTI